MKVLAKAAGLIDVCCGARLGIDVSAMTKVDDNLCAAFAVLRACAKDCSCTIDWQGVLPTQLMLRLRANGFFGTAAESLNESDTICGVDNDTLPFRRFDLEELKQFVEYVKWVFLPGRVPEMTSGVRGKLQECFTELFLNCVEHSETRHGVFVCGQFDRTAGVVKLSIADAGIGIRERLWRSKKEPSVVLSGEAIRWALRRGSTTRDIPGGLGLDILLEFIRKNSGRLVILSDAGCFECGENGEVTEELEYSFPGTLVTVAINARDEKSYYLRTEAEPSPHPQ